MKTFLFILSFMVFYIVSMGQDTLTYVFDDPEITDAYISQVRYQPNGLGQSLIAAHWTYFGEEGIGRGLIQFDFSEIPQRAKVISAVLSLYHDPISEHIGHSALGGDNTGQLVRIIEPWIDTEVIWGIQPRTTIINEITLIAPTTYDQDYPEIDVTDMVQNMVDHPNENHGFMIKLKDEGLLYNSLVFTSVEHPYADIHPSLVVTYTTGHSLHDLVVIRNGPDKGKDAYINVVNMDPNGSGNSLISSVWTHDGQIGTGRSLLDFDLSIIPPEKEITKAELSLYYFPGSGHTGHSRLGGKNKMLIQKIVEPWKENEVTWLTQPATTNENEVRLSPTNIDDEDFLNIDVTDIVKQMLEDNEQNYGFLIRLADEDKNKLYRSLVFGSSDNDDEHLWPKLEIYTRTSLPGKKNLDDLVKLYPIPFNDYVTLQFDDFETGGLYKVSLMDRQGRVLLSREVSQPVINIQLNSYEKGIYFVRLTTPKGTVTRKLLKY